MKYLFLLRTETVSVEINHLGKQVAKEVVEDIRNRETMENVLEMIEEMGLELVTVEPLN